MIKQEWREDVLRTLRAANALSYRGWAKESAATARAAREVHAEVGALLDLYERDQIAPEALAAAARRAEPRRAKVNGAGVWKP